MADDKSIMDLTVDILVERQRWTKEELRNRFKRTRPFRMEPVSKEEIMDTLSEDEINEAIGGR